MNTNTHEYGRFSSAFRSSWLMTQMNIAFRNVNVVIRPTAQTARGGATARPGRFFRLPVSYGFATRYTRSESPEAR